MPAVRVRLGPILVALDQLNQNTGKERSRASTPLNRSTGLPLYKKKVDHPIPSQRTVSFLHILSYLLFFISHLVPEINCTPERRVSLIPDPFDSPSPRRVLITQHTTSLSLTRYLSSLCAKPFSHECFLLPRPGGLGENPLPFISFHDLSRPQKRR